MFIVPGSWFIGGCPEPGTISIFISSLFSLFSLEKRQLQRTT
ncbi:hypothetical protein AVDCRST_MAG92-2099 [uncultured Coleofasciculus sp.]|uniref:Uncharacterized protein n=1 Tax=uncultured Coleofasciculus sp. TaxID=1267456 RepID=A0A6J4ILA3_9CYAN|nr:hypothetical protein AVDCRST_MAG92-2099 [uncultured Coleofasciculus sp.]